MDKNNNNSIIAPVLSEDARREENDTFHGIFEWKSEKPKSGNRIV